MIEFINNYLIPGLVLGSIRETLGLATASNNGEEYDS